MELTINKYYVGLLNGVIVGLGECRGDVMQDTREQLEVSEAELDALDIVEATEALYNEVLWGRCDLRWIERENGVLDVNECLCDACGHTRILK